MAWSSYVNYTIPAAGSIQNILAGQANEYIGEAATITIYGSCDTAGDTFSLTGFRGHTAGEQFVPTSVIPVASTAGTVKTNENFIGQFAVPANTRLVLTVTGTAAHVGRFQFVMG